MLRRSSILLLLLFLNVELIAQCSENPGILFQSNNPMVQLSDIARSTAPMLWFSPDEPILFDEEGKIRIPMALPVDKPGTKPVVYYKFTFLYTNEKLKKEDLSYSTQEQLDLSVINGFDMIYYYYFDEESGLGSHKHDIESMSIQFNIEVDENCPEGKYKVVATRVVGHAHGVKWYQNTFTVTKQTFFPASIMIGEGKHASCTDQNADGVFTPGYDVTENINDAWGVRDIETSGILFTGAYQAWMTKKRSQKSLIFPPIAPGDLAYDNYAKEFGPAEENQTYELRPYPNYLEIEVPEDLFRFMNDKKPHDWPHLVKAKGETSIVRDDQTVNSYNSISFAYRNDNTHMLSVSLPLLIVKNVKAPMTGGWIYNKIYVGRNDAVGDEYVPLIGHQIVHTPSASRWIDPYIGLGYEFYDTNPIEGQRKYKANFVSEIGLKIRVNIEHTPAKFLGILGTNFWGLSLGWKNAGFGEFRYSGFVFGFGAGVF